jgi:hypothetical protein
MTGPEDFAPINESKELVMKILLAVLLISSFAHAHGDLARRPESFRVAKGSAVFVDFVEANYHITYDMDKKSAQVKAVIDFNMPETGRPLFDSVETPTLLTINGKAAVTQEIKTPGNETTLRMVDMLLNAGAHRMMVELPLKTLVDFKDGGVRSAFWTSDLSERSFLEKYLPSNLEYDQVKMIFHVKFVGGKSRQVIYTNGEVKEYGTGVYKIIYPPYFNVSSIFFHTVPAGTMDEIRYSLKSIDGRDIPVVIYVGKSSLGMGKSTLARLKSETDKVFHELESDYGAWPHPSLVIYNAGLGGMEYHGATITEFRALGHEMFHCYFARGVMPANGNAGWLDEALASWRDNGYQSQTSFTGTSRMSSQPYYTRTTDRAAYSYGERFMRFMDGKLKSQGGLKPFMRYMVDQQLFTPIFVNEFIQQMSTFYGVSVEEDFKKHTFGTKESLDVKFMKSKLPENTIHRKMTIEELQNYL